MDFDLPAEFGFTQHTTVDLLGVDHIALSVADPEGLAAFLCDHVGMKELARTGGWLSVGAGGRATHLALVGADGPREQGALVRMVLRVSDMRGAIAALPEGTEVEEEGPEVVTFTGPEGVVLGFTQVFGGIEYDLDHLVLRVAETEDLRVALAELGCVPMGDSMHVADKRFTLQPVAGATDRPLLDHIAFQVGSVATVESQARQRGLELDERSPADTCTIVLPGAEQVRLDFVEAGASRMPTPGRPLG
jgi:catechol 2,3-dioxygenase-like lactoylglutathione lyase family enzyme